MVVVDELVADLFPHILPEPVLPVRDGMVVVDELVAELIHGWRPGANS